MSDNGKTNRFSVAQLPIYTSAEKVTIEVRWWLQVSLDSLATMQPMSGIGYTITQHSGQTFPGTLN